jgi:alternative ribosome-rescue factor
MLRKPAMPQARAQEHAMAKSAKRPNKAKSIVAQPLFRCRQQQAEKGKGSYRRQASQQNWEACYFLAA